ncbi:MAG: hypothetical protein JSW51_02420, partial [Gemmatimonadota bacterium]
MKRLLGVVVVLSLASIGRATDAQSLHYEGGLSVSSGTYFYSERTTSWMLTNGLALGAGPFTFRVSLPVFRQNSLLITVSSAGPIPVGGSGTDAESGGRGGGQGNPHVVGVSGLPALSESSAVDSSELITTVAGYDVAVGDPAANLNVGLY